MEYRGQIIHQFDVLRDEAMFTSNSRQITLFTRIVIPTLAVITLIYAILQPDSSMEDFVVYGAILLLLAFIYFRIIRQLEKYQEFDLDQLQEALVVMEYGIELPPFTKDDMDMTTDDYYALDPIFVTYNEIEKIELTSDKVMIYSTKGQFTIDLQYYPFYVEETEETYKEQIEFFIRLVEKIQGNLEKIENRDHPTIIPKAYFRNI